MNQVNIGETTFQAVSTSCGGFEVGTGGRMVRVRGEWFGKAHRLAKPKSRSSLRSKVKSLHFFFLVDQENTAVI